MYKENTLENVTAAVIHCKLVQRQDRNYAFTIGRAVKTFPDSLVAEVDIRLPEVIDFLNTRSPWKAAALMRKTLKHWENPGISLEDSPETKVVFPRFVGVGKTSGNYTIKSPRYQVELVNGTYEVVTAATKKEEIAVSKKWLDEKFPGLSIKVDLLSALSLNPEEVSKLALDSVCVKVEKQDISTIDFD